MNKPIVISFIILSLLSFLQIDCKKDTVSTPTENTPDTTSHNFTFTSYTFGGSGGSSYFKDVAIINDSDIWAVGAIYTSPETVYNAAHWDGKSWKLIQIPYYTICGQANKTSYPAASVFSITPTSTWITMDGSQIAKYTGINHVETICLPVSFSISKLWGTGQTSVFAVGSNGNILHFDGLTWKKQESGTTIDLRDVWGSVDGKTIWASGWSNDDDKSILLIYDGITWKTIWQRVGISSQSPYGFFATSVYADKSLFVAAGRAVHRASVVDTTQSVTLPWFPYRIRGSGENNIAVAGDNGMIWHYNGATWKELHLKDNQTLYSVSISKTLLLAVGSDNSSFLSSALVFIGKR